MRKTPFFIIIRYILCAKIRIKFDTSKLFSFYFQLFFNKKTLVVKEEVPKGRETGEKTDKYAPGNNNNRKRGKAPVLAGSETGCSRERDGMLLICPARGKLLRRAGQYLVACVRIPCGGRQKT